MMASDSEQLLWKKRLVLGRHVLSLERYKGWRLAAGKGYRNIYIDLGPFGITLWFFRRKVHD